MQLPVNIKERLNSLRHMEYDKRVEEEIKSLEALREKRMLENGPIEGCHGAWINDCPYPHCQCAKEFYEKYDEDHLVEGEYKNSAYSCLYWVIFFVLLILSLIFLK